MKTLFLLSYKWKIFGYTGFALVFIYYVFVFISGCYCEYPYSLFNNSFAMQSNQEYLYKILDLETDILTVIAFISLLVIGFSKEKVEDEYINHLRLNSFAWAIIVNAFYYLVVVVFLNKGAILLIGFNLFTPIIIYYCRFKYLLFKLNRKISNEE